MYGVLVISVFIVILPLAASYADRFIPLDIPVALSRGGYVLFGLSGCLSYWSFLVLVTSGAGTAFPADPPTKFVVTGPYRYVRNPMYLGNLGMVLAVSLLWTSGGILIYFFVLCALTDRYVALVEEPKLLERFGSGYDDYRRIVHRWIPGVDF